MQAAKEVVSTAVILSKPGVLQGIVATGLEDIKKGFKDNVINGTAYTRSKYITEITLNVGSLFIGAGEIKAASGLNKAGSISKLAKLEKATGLLDDAARAADKADDVLRYTSKVENILEDGGALLGKSTKGGNKFGKIIGGADNAAEKKLTTAACFVAGTVVLTNVGYESIEKIKAGDTVYSQNAETGEKGYKKVVRTFQKEVDTLVYLKIGSKEIVTTENHPFYVEGKGFVHAGELKEGEKVVTASGETLTVDKVNIEKTKEKTKVYNFEVEDWHTYFVSTEEILVHNDCRAPLPEGVGELNSSATKTLYHYTNEKGLNGILESNELRPSLKANNPKDARYGNGQYLSDIIPETTKPTSLASKFIRVPNKYKYTDFIEIDVTGLEVITGRNGVYVIPNEGALDITGRIVRSGRVGK